MRLLFSILFFLLSVPSHAQKESVFEMHSLHFTDCEQRYKIPKGLLTAISRVESGRYHEKHKRVMTWPWVIHAEGKGKFFSSKQEAITAVQDLMQKGVKNIDMGLMQVNRLHHPGAFSSLEHAFDPQKNIEYAAKFLAGLKKELGSWSKAVAHYHSAVPEHHIPYRNKVYKMWQDEQHHSFQSWIQQQSSDSGFENDKEVSPFRSPQFRIIRLKPARQPLLRRSLEKGERGAQSKSQDKNPTGRAPLRLIKRTSPIALGSSQSLQNRFRFIKHRVTK